MCKLKYEYCVLIVFTCHHFGRGVITAGTDHKPLNSIFNKPLLTAPEAPSICTSRTLLQRAQKDTEQLNQADCLNVTSQCLSQIRKHTHEDESLQIVKAVVLRGWPDHWEEAPVTIAEYVYLEEISAQDGVLVKSHRVIVPKSLPAISNTSRRWSIYRPARDTLHWPKMQCTIMDYVSQRSACNEYSHEQQRETHALPMAMVNLSNGSVQTSKQRHSTEVFTAQATKVCDYRLRIPVWLKNNREVCKGMGLVIRDCWCCVCEMHIPASNGNSSYVFSCFLVIRTI